jgi:hypothetical protein
LSVVEATSLAKRQLRATSASTFQLLLIFGWSIQVFPGSTGKKKPSIQVIRKAVATEKKTLMTEFNYS